MPAQAPASSIPSVVQRRFVAVRRAAGAAALALVAAAAVTPLPAAAQVGPGGVEQVQPDIENGKFQFEGQLVRAEFVRAGAGENYYPTSKLDKGASVVVVGAKGNWLKILPPEGSFSYVQKVSVQKFGDGRQGKVAGTQQPWVRAGSGLQPLMWAMQTRLAPRDTVEIVGEDELYFKIKPPTGAYLYIAKDAVEARPNGEGRPVAETPPVTPPITPPAGPEQPPVTPPVAEATAGSTPVQPERVAPPTQPSVAEAPAAGTAVLPPIPNVTPATGPSAAPEAPAVAEVPAEEQPKILTAAEAVAKLQELEAKFADASQQPLENQPLVDLAKGYKQVAGAQGINDVTRRVAEVRLNTLKVRSDAREMARQHEAARRDAAAKVGSLTAEHNELGGLVAQSQLKLFTAVGTLRASSLQVSKTPLYRVTDPQSGRTLAYVWGTDAKLAGMVDKFVGLRGPIGVDP
ncbi:MAG TPA: hypothetical protein VF796_09620, partial [Humisphaera sp.]